MRTELRRWGLVCELDRVGLGFRVGFGLGVGLGKGLGLA